MQNGKIVLSTFDLACVMNMLRKHLQTSRQGHLDGQKRVFDTGRDSAKDTASLINNTHIIIALTLKNANNGKDSCLDREKDIPCKNVLPVSFEKKIRITTHDGCQSQMFRQQETQISDS